MREVFYRIISSPARLWAFIGLMAAETFCFVYLIGSWIRDSKNRGRKKGVDEL